MEDPFGRYAAGRLRRIHPIARRQSTAATVVRTPCQRSAHNARSSDTSSDWIVVTHPFHPFVGRRLRVLFERRHGDGRFYVCEGGRPGTTTVAEEGTNRGAAPGQRPLTYEALAILAETMKGMRRG